MSIEEKYSKNIIEINRVIRNILIKYAYIDEEDVITRKTIDKIMDYMEGVVPFYVAFIHDSIDKVNNYEKYEFLGDGVLANAAKRYIVEHDTECECLAYSNYFNYYSSNEQNTINTKILGLDKLIIFNDALIMSDAVYGDIFESFLGVLEIRASEILRGEGTLICRRIFTKLIDDQGGLDKKYANSNNITYVQQLLRNKKTTKNISYNVDKGVMFKVFLTNAGKEIIKKFSSPNVLRKLKTSGDEILLGQAICSNKKDAKNEAFRLAKNKLTSVGLTEKWSNELGYRLFESKMHHDKTYLFLLNYVKENGYKYLYTYIPSKWGSGNIKDYNGFVILGVKKDLTTDYLFITSIRCETKSDISNYYSEVFKKWYIELST